MVKKEEYFFSKPEKKKFPLKNYEMNKIKKKSIKNNETKLKKNN